MLKKIIYKIFIIIWIISAGDIHAKDIAWDKLFQNINKNQKIAVAWIYDGDTDTYTGYSNLWRDKIESELVKNGFQVLTRKDLVIVMDEIEKFDQTIDITNNCQADIIVTGAYYYHKSSGFLRNKMGYVDVILKALDVNKTTIIGSLSISNIKISDEDKIRMQKIIGKVRKTKKIIVSEPIREDDENFNPLPLPVEVHE
jgi:hypothetical protein